MPIFVCGTTTSQAASATAAKSPDKFDHSGNDRNFSKRNFSIEKLRVQECPKWMLKVNAQSECPKSYSFAHLMNRNQRYACFHKSWTYLVRIRESSSLTRISRVAHVSSDPKITCILYKCATLLTAWRRLMGGLCLISDRGCPIWETLEMESDHYKKGNREIRSQK